MLGKLDSKLEISQNLELLALESKNVFERVPSTA